MATIDLVASTVMDQMASLMNDTAKSIYTYVNMLPYLQMALDELQEDFELNSISVTEKTSAIIQVDAGNTEIVFNGVGVPALPDDMIEPQQLWERNRGIDPFVPMRRREYLPHNLEGTKINMFVYYVWQDQKILLLPSDADNDIKIDYIKQLFTPLVDENSQINLINAKSFLQYRGAALLAEFIERNITSANSLSANALLSIDRARGIAVKGKQAINTRRRPFRNAYKRRGPFR
jgi:hypothetical protein